MKQILIGLCCALLVIGCSGENDEQQQPQKPTVEDQLAVNGFYQATWPYSSNDIEVKVNTNRDWTAVTSADWLTVSPSSGNGNSAVTISWPDNMTLKDRKGTVTFKAGTQNVSVEVTQKHKSDSAKIVSSQAIMGNLVKYEKDSIEVVFDTPVKIMGSSFGNGDYLVDDEPTAYDEGRRYQWPFPAGKAGIDVNCSFDVQSQTDNTRTKVTCKVPFYDKRKIFDFEKDGSIRNCLLSPDNKSLWLSMSNGYKDGNKLVQVSLDNLSVMKTIDMPFAPNDLCINPYNGLLYVLPLTKNLYLGYADYFCVVNPESGAIVKTVQIEQSPYAHPQYPTNYPLSIAFTRDGFGIIVLMSSATTELEWRYIDSADGDKITLGSKSDISHEIASVRANYDYSRIYATPTNYFTTIKWFDRQHKIPVTLKLSPKFNSTKYYAGGTMVGFVMSPFANKALISTSPGSQCAVNLEPVSYSEVCTEEARDSRSCWDALVSDRDYAYLVCGYSGFLELLDLTQGEVIYATNHTFILGTNYDLVSCHFLPDTNQLLVTTFKSITLLNAAEMKRRSVLL